MYDAVDVLDDHTLRNALLTFEERRPRIYRRCRREMSKQFNGKDRGILKSDARSRNADMLSYKWALLHYYEEATEWPMWLIRPLTGQKNRPAA